jgi:chemotaxis protein CheD
VTGLLHVLLPDSTIDAAKAARQPATFVDTGVPALFKASYRLGARKERMIVKVAGGAHAGRATSDQLPDRQAQRARPAPPALEERRPPARPRRGRHQTCAHLYVDVATGGIVVRSGGRTASSDPPPMAFNVLSSTTARSCAR